MLFRAISNTATLPHADHVDIFKNNHLVITYLSNWLSFWKAKHQKIIQKIPVQKSRHKLHASGTETLTSCEVVSKA